MSRDSQSGSMMVNVIILTGISTALISGMTKVINNDLKATRQQEVRDSIASAQRIIRKTFSCEKSLGIPQGSLLTKCPDNLPILNNYNEPILHPSGKLGDLDIYIKGTCDLDKGIRFQYMRAREKNSQLEALPDPLTGIKKDFADLYEQKYFCASFLPSQATSPEFASKGLPAISCAEGRAWSGMKDGMPICSSPTENLRAQPACTAGVPATTTYWSNCALGSICVNFPMGSSPGLPGTCKPGELAPPPVCTIEYTGPFLYRETCT